MDPDADRAPRLPKTQHEKETQRRLIVILEEACLETVKRGQKFELMNCDDHLHILRKNKRPLEDARPDICHQCLLQLMDSPLNKAGLLQVYIHTKKNVLIEMNPQTRIPRTFKRFSGLMVQLLHKLSIRAVDGPVKLMKVVKNPVERHLPAGARRIGTSCNSKKLVRLEDFVPTLPDGPVVWVVGAMAVGAVEADYVEEEIAISEYALSGAAVCGKLCNAYEQHWGVL
eukprot:CAMPEP_0174242886 /NCGR_PEP_ID=MMETSP0417-20130205/29500_1 /TAXON_ID=242541 /ORGANISM="Mayorella sp, Strain BSH-02190019" /LENGTH=227 /DNA_ID=CAMNT_0015322325 /DNA_START=50 /DNA_END=733 /DNA_ORIENTATION=+